MLNGAIARIILRYGVGGALGYELGTRLSSDGDIVMVTAAGIPIVIGAGTEAYYFIAKKYGWPT